MQRPARPMTPAEKYYAFLDATWPMNLMLVAELGRVFPGDLVGRRWQEFSERRILTRLRPAADLTIVDGGPGVDFETTGVPPGGVEALLAAESRRRHGLDRPLMCRYWSGADGERSWVCLIGHHSIIDARAGTFELQQFVRSLAGDDAETQDEIPAREPPSREPAWQADRRALVRLLRDLGQENERAGPLSSLDWPDSSGQREPRFRTVVLPPADSEALRQQAAEHGTRVFPTLAAAALTGVTTVVCRSSEETLQLNVPIDLTSSLARANRHTAVDVAVVSRRYRVRADDPWHVAQLLREDIDQALGRSEGELFFHLTRVAGVETFAQGVRLVEHAVRSAPAAVSVTNLGVIDAAGDPPWLTSLSAHQAPTPNQIVSSIGLAYRGRQVVSIATDDARMPQPVAAQLVQQYADTLLALASPGDGR